MTCHIPGWAASENFSRILRFWGFERIRSQRCAQQPLTRLWLENLPVYLIINKLKRNWLLSRLTDAVLRLGFGFKGQGIACGLVYPAHSFSSFAQ